MQKTTGRQIITTINFTGSASESTVWTEAEARDEWIIDEYAEAHRENAADASYTAQYGQAETFEYELPGLRVVVLLTGGELMTVWTIEDVDAARLHKAVRREQPVTISYTKADGTDTVRTIEPTGLRLTKAGDTIIKAMDRDSGEARTFRLDRVSAYTVHRTRRTVRTERPAPSKAELWESWKAQGGRVEVLDNLTGEVKTISRAAYDKLTSARDPREPRAVDEALAQTSADTRPQVLIRSRGWTGRTQPGTRAFGAGGWSVIVDLDGAYRHHSPTGSLRVADDDLVTLAELEQARRATV